VSDALTDVNDTKKIPTAQGMLLYAVIKFNIFVSQLHHFYINLESRSTKCFISISVFTFSSSSLQYLSAILVPKLSSIINLKRKKHIL
jgi:hypothetical protein